MQGVTAAQVLALGIAAGLAGCSGNGAGGGGVGGSISAASTIPDGATIAPTGPPTTTPATTTVTENPASTTVTTAPATTGTTRRPGGLQLAGNDLGVTRIGAPFREAVTAVSAVIGRPVGDPASDAACIGAEGEASWDSFRLGASGGKVSGWLSTSKTLTTPAGIAVGTSLAALRQAYGARLQVSAPSPDAATVFIVGDANLGGTLTGSAASDAVTSLFNGTCEAP